MLNVEELSTEPIDIDSVIADIEAERQELPAGTYPARLADLVETTNRGKYPTVTAHFRITDGDFANRRVGYQRLTMWDVLRMFSAAGFAFTAAELTDEQSIGEKLNALLEANNDGEALFRVRVDWEGFSTAARDQALCEATGATTYQDAKTIASPDDWTVANGAARVCSTMTDFERNEDGTFNNFFIDPVTGEEKRAQVRIKGFTPIG